MAKYKPKVVNTQIYVQGIKGVKTGNMARLRTISEQELIHMSKEDMAHLIASTSKQVVQNVRNVLKKYQDKSPFIMNRVTNGYAIPKETKYKTAMRKEEKELRQEIRDLAYVARLKTTSLSGMRSYIKDFKEKTGKNPLELSSEDWQEIRKKIEEGYDSTSVIQAYDVESKTIENLEEIEKSTEKAKQSVNADMTTADLFNALD